MHPFLEKVEHFNSRLIPYILVILLFVIITELFFKEFAHEHQLPLEVIDYIIVAVFVVDLFFIGRKCKSAKYFFRNYYLDILAVFPFALFFKLVGEIYRLARFAGLAEEFAISQAIVHETVEVEKEAKVLREARFARYSRLVSRLIRFVTKSRFFQKWHEGNRKGKGRLKKLEKLKANNDYLLLSLFLLEKQDIDNRQDACRV